MVLSVSVAVGRAALFAPICGSSGILQSGFGLRGLNPQLSTIHHSACTTLHQFALLCSDFESSRVTFHVSRNLVLSDQNGLNLTKSDQFLIMFPRPPCLHHSKTPFLKSCPRKPLGNRTVGRGRLWKAVVSPGRLPSS